jgi:transcriptional regulator with XRE-family HTH domain
MIERDHTLPRPRTVPRVRLAAQMLAAREALGLSRNEVAARLDMPHSTIYRIEKGLSSPHRRNLIALMDFYGINDQRIRESLLELARQGNSRGGWLHAYADLVPEPYLEFIAFEEAASRLAAYECLSVPGLLQTGGYARAVIAGQLPVLQSNEIDHRVRLRLQRQDILLGEEPVELKAVIDEAAIRRVVGSKSVMRDQLRALLTPRPNVRLQVIPYEAGAHPGMLGSFVVMEFPDPSDSDLVYIESMAGDLFREARQDLARFHGIFTTLESLAYDQAESAALIEAVAREMEGT